MRKLLLASYQFRTGEATHNENNLVAIHSSVGNSDLTDVKLAHDVFSRWFNLIYPESELLSCRIHPAITESTTFPNIIDKPVDPKHDYYLDAVFNNPAPGELRKAGINTIAQAQQLTDEQLLQIRGIGKMAIQRLRNLK